MKLINHENDVKKRRKRSSSIQKANLSTSKHNFLDLISDLPDSLLLHILSLLDMDEVMKTSLLSRRWRYLWKFIPCLCFQSFARHFKRIELTNFIDRCLFHYGGYKIRKLHIIFKYKDKHAPLANSWIHFAIRHQVEDFKLDFLGGDDYSDEECTSSKFYRLPRSFYICTSLTSLNLRACNLNLPDSFRLDSLKKLSLQLLELCSDSIERLSSSCPVLEDIYLLDCNSLTDLNIVITNAHVKRLEISANELESSHSVRINAPTLVSLGIYRCCPVVKFYVEELGSLMSVDLIGEEWLISGFGEFYFNQNRKLERLLYDLRHVKHLKLCSMCTQVLSLMMLQGAGIFSISATCLELNVSLEKWELPGISYLLCRCSNLEKLKLVNQIFYEEIKHPGELIDGHDFEEEEYWASFETDLPSIMQNIKTIELNGFSGRSLEEFVRFLLKNAKVLERMMINTPKVYFNNFELLYKLSQRLTVFSRSSAIAKLIITC